MLPSDIKTPVQVNTAIGQDITNMPSTEAGKTTQAGYASLIAEGTPTSDSYFRVINENETLGYSPTTYEVNEMLHAEETDRLIEELPDILLDENIDEGFKQLALRTATDESRTENDTSLQYARDELEKPEVAEENLEYLDNKQAMFKWLGDVNEYNQAQQAILDESNLTTEQGNISNAGDFLTMLIPFYEQINQTEAVTKAIGGDAGAITESFLLLGDSKQQFIDYVTSLPLDERIPVMQQLSTILDEANTTLGYTNRLTGKAQLENIVYGGDMSDVERWAENITSLLDASIIGKPLAWAAKAIKGAKSAEAVDTLRAGVKASDVRNPTRPSSPHRMAQQSNAETTRKQVAEIIEDTSEEAAQALSGAKRTDAVTDSVLPEVQVSGQGLRNKVGNVLADADKTRISNPQLREMVEDTAVGALTKKELQAATAKVVEKLQRAKGVTSRNEMFQVRQQELGAQIRGVYGPTEGGFTSAQEGIDLVTTSMRSQGVTPDALKILKKNEKGEYDELDNIPTEDGDYLVSFDFDYSTKFSDVTGNWEKFGVVRNFLDRVPLFAKFKVNRHLIDPASTLDPHIVLGANAAVDKSARITNLMLEDAKAFSDKLKNLPNERQQLVDQYIKEANENGLKFDAPSLKADWGFDDAELDALSSFRQYWDNVWAMRNRTDAKQMRNDGFLVYEDASTDTRIYGKPRNKGNLDKSRAILDPTTEDLRTWSDAELDELYSSGGGIMEMRRPTEFDGIISDYVVYRNSDSVRSVKDTDVVYPYRDGYYQVDYTSPHFIVKEVTDGNRTYTKAIATAETVRDADLYLKRLSLADPGGKYLVRGNVKDGSERAGFERDVFETYGDTSQRIRGQRLTDATAVVRDTVQSNIKGPVDAMIDTSRALGGRVGMNDYLNATKQRFMDSYEDLLPKKNGITMFPARVEEIGTNAKALDKDVANARTTFEYIAFLEHGYVSAVDEAYKGLLRAAAEVVGALPKVSKGEGVLRGLSNATPTEIFKGAGFILYIALNPIRQFLLNAHQATLLLANFPKYMTNPRGITADLAAFTDLTLGGRNIKKLAKASNRSVDELKLMYNEFLRSGLADAIDFQNMVRGSLQTFATGSSMSKSVVARAAGKAIDIPRKVGFDAGEWVNIASSWLAHYDRAAEGGKALNKTDFHTIGAQARSYMLNMNRAGDMPYNHNMAAILFQFFQVPHKSLLSLTNRTLSQGERLRLFAYNGLAYSLPPAAMYGLFGDILPDRDENPDLHDSLVQGLEFYLFNKALRTISPDTNIDFSSLAPADAYGIYEMIHALITTEVGQVVANSPSGSLFFGDNPRLANLMASIGRFVNPADEDPVTAGQLFHEFVSISSGYSNGFKAAMAFKYHKLYNAQGVVTDPSVTTPEAIAKAFGFGTMDEALNYHMGNKVYKKKEEAIKDVNTWWKEHSSRLFREGIPADSLEYEQKVMAQAMHIWKDEPWAMEQLSTLLSKQVAKGDGRMYDTFLRAADMMPPSELEDFFRHLPEFDPDKKKALDETIKNINEYNFEEN